MSERERWIVYPLLFLALGAALRDKLMKRSVTDHLVCKELSVVDDDFNSVARLVVLPSTDGQPAVGSLAVSGQVRADEVLANNLARAQAAESNNWATLTELLRSAGVAIRAVSPGGAPPPPRKTRSPEKQQPSAPEASAADEP